MQLILITTKEVSLLRRTDKLGKVYEIKHIVDSEFRIEEKDITNCIPIKLYANIF